MTFQIAEPEGATPPQKKKKPMRHEIEPAPAIFISLNLLHEDPSH